MKKYIILDKDGNYINEYNTTLELKEVYNTPANSFSTIANNISALLKRNKPRTRNLSIKEIVCVKRDDYINYKEEIRWLLTKDDILVINKKGRIVGIFKSKQDADCSFNNSAKAGVARVLNKVNRETHGCRVATREHYINMISKDPMYYMREFEKNQGVKKIPVELYNFKTGEFIRDFKSLTEAANYMGCTKEYIRQSVERGNPVLKTDYYFKKKEEI